MTTSIRFLQLVNSPARSAFFLLLKLPAAFFSGVRIRYADEQKAIVSVPFKWLTQNPFKSTYFASLSMAAEMSTGVLAMAHLYKQHPPVSMLITKTEGTFFKKCKDRISFTCEDGENFRNIIREAQSSGKSVSFTARSRGANKEGEIVAEFQFTWSFKVKQSQPISPIM